jgi:8-oxo-dGTP pyrophosphatase MutT (NUDIX family)
MKNYFFDANGGGYPLPAGEPIYWRISGYALVERGGEILTVVPTWNTLFELPGGGIEEQERITDGIIRECYEETGYRIRVVGSEPFYFSEENFYHKHHKKFYHSLIAVYLAELKSTKQSRSVINTFDGYEIEKVLWKNPDFFTKENTHRIVYPAIKKLRIERP